MPAILPCMRTTNGKARPRGTGQDCLPALICNRSAWLGLLRRLGRVVRQAGSSRRAAVVALSPQVAAAVSILQVAEAVLSPQVAVAALSPQAAVVWARRSTTAKRI